MVNMYILHDLPSQGGSMYLLEVCTCMRAMLPVPPMLSATLLDCLAHLVFPAAHTFVADLRMHVT